MSAADLLRVALDDAPDIEVTRDDDGTATLHVKRDDWGTPAWFALTIEEDKALRLVELLLAAAPHLADLIDAQYDVDAPEFVAVCDAITEKAAVL